MTWINAHRKAIVAGATLVVVVLTRALGANDPIVTDAVAFLGAIGVYATPNS